MMRNRGKVGQDPDRNLGPDLVADLVVPDLDPDQKAVQDLDHDLDRERVDRDLGLGPGEVARGLVLGPAVAHDPEVGLGEVPPGHGLGQLVDREKVGRVLDQRAENLEANQDQKVGVLRDPKADREVEAEVLVDRQGKI